MSDYEKYVAKRLLQHAERMEVLKSGQAFQFYKVVPDLKMEIIESRREVGNVIQQIVVALNKLDQRVFDVERRVFYLDQRTEALEKWSDQATCKIYDLYKRTEILAYWTREATIQFRMLCENHERVAEDVVRLGTSLNQLHGLLKKQQQGRIISGILGVILSLIPYIGSSLSNGSQAAVKVFMKIATATSKGVVNHFTSVDLSSFQTVGALTSAKFMSKLEPANREPIFLLMKNSEFKSIENFRKQLAIAQEIMLNDEPVKVSDESEPEIESRFSMITVDSKDGTADMKDAVNEMGVLCGRRIVEFNNSEEEIKTELRKRRNKKSRITYEAFRETFMYFYDLHKESSRTRQVPPEIGALFKEAAHPYDLIDIEDAIPCYKIFTGNLGRMSRMILDSNELWTARMKRKLQKC